MDLEADEIRKFSGLTDHSKEKFNDEGYVTATSREQVDVERLVSLLYSCFHKNQYVDASSFRLDRESHISYLRKGLKNLTDNLSCLDASRPWLVYWSLHALELLDVRIVGEEASHIVEFLKNCQNPDGGFGGGPNQFSHLAPTYAAVCALSIIGTKEAYDAINRETLLSYLFRMRNIEGAFTMHDSGEVDIRGVYCAVTVARITNIYSEELFHNSVQWVLRCQTYEGGFSGSPGLEAHGGYTFCGIAALTLMKAQNLCQTEALLRWGVNRQMRFEGGFQGRTNKLVDGCYSFWQGGLFPILHSILSMEGEGIVSAEKWMFHQEALQEYLLICCQFPKGGFVDKPGKRADYYHTCYTLSGLSIAQHFSMGNLNTKLVIGDPSNELALDHTLYNISMDAAVSASQYFSQLPIPSLPEVERDS